MQLHWYLPCVLVIIGTGTVYGLISSQNGAFSSIVMRSSQNKQPNSPSQDAVIKFETLRMKNRTTVKPAPLVSIQTTTLSMQLPTLVLSRTSTLTPTPNLAHGVLSSYYIPITHRTIFLSPLSTRSEILQLYIANISLTERSSSLLISTVLPTPLESKPYLNQPTLLLSPSPSTLIPTVVSSIIPVNKTVPLKILEIRKIPNDRQTFVGETVAIACVVSGLPRPHVTWQKFGRKSINYDYFDLTDINASTVVSHIVFYSAKFSNSGSYTCLAQNRNGITKSNYTLIVYGTLTPTLTPSPTRSGLISSQNGVFSSIVMLSSQNKRPNLSQIPETLFMSPSPSTLIPTVVSSIIPAVNKTVPARVISIDGGGIYKPKINVILHCSVEGNPVPTVTWKKMDDRGNLISVYSNFVLQHNNRTIVLKNVTLNDTGTYVCIAKNEYNRDEKNSTVIIGVPLKILKIYKIPTDRLTFVGESVAIACVVSGLPRPHVTWQKFGGESINYHYLHLRDINASTVVSHIVFYSAKFSNSGSYTCLARNRNGITKSNITLIVYAKPHVNFLQYTLSVLTGTSVNLSCVVYGFPKPDVLWIKNRHQIHQSDHYYISENPTTMVYTWQSVLHIANTWRNDTGNYSCVVENVAGSNVSKMSLHVFDFPDLSAASPLEYVQEGQNFTITCYWKKEIGILKIDNLEWIKDGKRIDLSSPSQYKNISFEQLLVANSSDKQSGRYQCKGNIRMVSKLSSFVDITVFVPSGPVVFESEPETSTTGIRLSWLPIEKSFWNGQVITYKISLMENHREVKVFTTTDLKAIISGLQPSTTYKIILSGITKLGEIPPTEKEATTKENKNSKQYEMDVKLTDVDFSKSLEDSSSGRYIELKTSLEQSIDSIYKDSSIRFQFIKSTIAGFRKGSVIAVVSVSFDTTFSQKPSIAVERLNKAKTIAGHEFDKSFTKVKDFDECKDKSFNSCHDYANCTNIDGSYICKCFEGFFGDGEKCQGAAQIIAKSASNVTQYVETNVTLVCTVIGDPNPVITWLRRSENGDVRQIKSTTNKYDANLTIVHATIEHSDVYVCNASNFLGHQSYETRLTIKPVVVDIDIEIKLSDKKFEEELKNQSSSEYKILEQNVYVELFKFFNNTPGFDDVEILGFANGSVKVLFRIIIKVRKPSTNTWEVVTLTIGKKLYNQLKKGHIGKILVDPEALQFKERPPPPVNVTYSDVKKSEMHIYWDPPELHELFSIQKYYVRYRKFGEFWINDSKRDDLSTNSPLRNLESNSFYSVEVIAENGYGVSKKSRTIVVKTMENKVISPWYYIIPIICVLVTALMAIVFFLYRRFFLSGNWHVNRKKSIKQSQNKSGLSFQLVIRNEQNDNVCENEGFTQTDAKKCWDEIPRTSIELTEEILVPGQFGVIVVEGNVMRPLLDNREPCSVKLFKDYTTGQCTRDLVEEIHNISTVGTHKNIVNLIGACTDSDGSPLLVFELCCNGTLENYLKTNRKIDDEKVVSKTIKMEWANEIAQGMNHLAAVNIVHRDLAARNVFLTEDLTAKISNFGLSRNICEQGSYEKQSGGKLPARWMALESITDGSYSLKSDVWSFGILLWEIETGASLPYQEYEVTKIVDMLSLGYRLPKPDECPDKIYDLMFQCWKINPLDRPNFDEIADIVEKNLANENTFINIPLGS